MNEPGLAEAINRLRGEWAERAGGELSAVEMTWEELAGQASLDADVVVFPSRYLGELCVRGWLRPVRAHVLQSGELNAEDILPLARRELTRWGNDTMAVALAVDPSAVGIPSRDHPAISLLTKAAPDVVTDDRLGVLFDPETMTPRITEPPFVEALAYLVTDEAEQAESFPAAAPRVPVIGFADRLVGVTTTSRNAASAFNLVAWLASAEISSQLASAGAGPMPVRRSLAASHAWYDPNLAPNERMKLAEMLRTALSQPRSLLIPRIPGVDDYVAALDEAVQAARSADSDPQSALQQAAERWQQITDAHGRDSQRQAYLNHLGISDP